MRELLINAKSLDKVCADDESHTHAHNGRIITIVYDTYALIGGTRKIFARTMTKADETFVIRRRTRDTVVEHA